MKIGNDDEMIGVDWKDDCKFLQYVIEIFLDKLHLFMIVDSKFSFICA